MPKEYAVDIYHHLRRARAQLDSGEHENLFYAAFELRCGVEARIQDYLNARSDISKKKKKGWKVAAAGRELDKAFTEGLKIVETVLYSPITGKEAPFFHTPVVPQLRQEIGQIGELLHAQKKTIAPDSPFWDETRNLLESIFTMAAESAQGTLLAPILFSPSGKMSLKAYYHVNNPISSVFEDFSAFSAGKQIGVKVGYHDKLPEAADQYLNAWQASNP